MLGFRVQLDLEGSSGLVVRGTGTACSLLAVVPSPHANIMSDVGAGSSGAGGVMDGFPGVWDERALEGEAGVRVRVCVCHCVCMYVCMCVFSVRPHCLRNL